MNCPRTFQLIAAAAMLALAGLGCQSDMNPRQGPSDPVSPKKYPNIAVTNEDEPSPFPGASLNGLQFGLVFNDPIVTPGDGDLKPMEVSAPIRNVARPEHTLNIQYRFEFYDKSRRLLTEGQRWIFLALDPRVETQLRANALDVNAVDWRLVIRPAK